MTKKDIYRIPYHTKEEIGRWFTGRYPQVSDVPGMYRLCQGLLFAKRLGSAILACFTTKNSAKPLSEFQNGNTVVELGATAKNVHIFK